MKAYKYNVIVYSSVLEMTHNWGKKQTRIYFPEKALIGHSEKREIDFFTDEEADLKDAEKYLKLTAKDIQKTMPKLPKVSYLTEEETEKIFRSHHEKQMEKELKELKIRKTKQIEIPDKQAERLIEAGKKMQNAKEQFNKEWKQIRWK